jgi:Secretion system C-terminal sorting domain
MKNVFISLITLIVYSTVTLPQAPDTMWTRKIGGAGIDVGNEIIQTSDGGFVIAGYTTSFGAGQRDAFLVKLDSLGNILWQKTYGTNLLEQAYSVKETYDGGLIISAFVYAATANLFLIKTNQNGDTLWTRNIGYSGNDYGTNIQLTEDGGFLVVGYTDSNISNGDRDIWLLKLDSTGTFLWQRTYGGTDAEEGFKLLKLSDGNLLISGYSQSFGSGDRDGWIVKADSSGNFIWSKSFGVGGYDEFTAAAEDESGELYITGTTESSGDRNLWIVKTDSGGNHLFTKAYGGSQWEWGHDIKRTNDGNFIVTGFNQSNSSGLRQLWILKIDQQGDTLWTKLIRSVNGSEGYSVIQTPDNGFSATGFASSSGTGPDVWVIRLKPDGTSGIEDEIFELPTTFYLEQNYPNPFNPSTSIQYAISSRQFVQLKVYDVLGNEIAILVDEYKSAGKHEVEFNLAQVSKPEISSGVYFYQLRAQNFVETKKLVLLR